jgi:hypothetical protein
MGPCSSRWQTDRTGVKWYRIKDRYQRSNSVILTQTTFKPISVPITCWDRWKTNYFQHFEMDIRCLDGKYHNSCRLKYNNTKLLQVPSTSIEESTKFFRRGIDRTYYEFWLSLCKIVRRSVILLLPLSADGIRDPIVSSWHKQHLNQSVSQWIYQILQERYRPYILLNKYSFWHVLMLYDKLSPVSDLGRQWL